MPSTKLTTACGAHSDYSRLLTALIAAGVPIHHAGARRRKRYDNTIPAATRFEISFPRTAFLFDGSGDFLGCDYVDSDECDAFAEAQR